MLTLFYLITGAILAMGFLRVVSTSSSDRARTLGFALVVASFVYVAFAMAAMESSWLLVEIGGVLLFLAFAALGQKRSLYWLAAGWGLHIVWDLGLHVVSTAEFVPFWYPVACTSFDLVVSGYVVRLARAPFSPTEASLA